MEQYRFYFFPIFCLVGYKAAVEQLEGEYHERLKSCPDCPPEEAKECIQAYYEWYMASLGTLTAKFGSLCVGGFVSLRAIVGKAGKYTGMPDWP